MICRLLELQPMERVSQWQALPPSETVLVVLGAPERSPVRISAYVQSGGAVLVANDRSDRRTFRQFGIEFIGGFRSVASSSDSFGGFGDCPIVTDLDASHPAVRGLAPIVANRPGMLSGVRDRRLGDYTIRSIARLPQLAPPVRLSQRGFAAALEHQNDGKILLLADPSVFSNQMLVHGDNARFALQSLAWLSSGRSSVLIVSEGTITGNNDPSNLEVLLPPPTRQEVLAALRNLPPDVLIDFGNAVAAVVEEEGIINELASSAIQSIPQRNYNRMLIVLATVVLGCVALLGVVTHRRFGAAGSTSRLQRRRRHKWRGAVERKLAADALIARFAGRANCSGVHGQRPFPQGLRCSGNPLESRRALRSMTRAAKHLRRKSVWYWTKRRLERLAQDTANWSQLLDTGQLTFESSSESGDSVGRPLT